MWYSIQLGIKSCGQYISTICSLYTSAHGLITKYFLQATGCEASFHFEDTPYYPMEHSVKLGEIYRQQAESLGMQFSDARGVLETHIGEYSSLVHVQYF